LNYAGFASLLLLVLVPVSLGGQGCPAPLAATTCVQAGTTSQPTASHSAAPVSDVSSALEQVPLGGAPQFAFNGAYAFYNVTVSGFAIHGYVYKTSVGYLVNAVDASDGTFSVETNYGGEFAYLSATVTATFEAPFPMPVVGSRDLLYLNGGEVPVDMIAPPNMTSYPAVMEVRPNVTVTIPAGTFLVDELSLANGSEEWVAVYSGLIVRETGAFTTTAWPDGVYGTMTLSNTNIAKSGAPQDYGLYAANAATLILVASAVTLVWRSNRRLRGP